MEDQQFNLNNISNNLANRMKARNKRPNLGRRFFSAFNLHPSTFILFL